MNIRKQFTVTAEVSAEFTHHGLKYIADAMYEWEVDAYKDSGRWYGTPDQWTPPESDYEILSERVLYLSITDTQEWDPVEGPLFEALKKDASAAIIDASRENLDDNVWEAFEKA